MTGDDLTTFHIRIDDGPETTIDVKTGVYAYAAAAVPALLGLHIPIEVDIWIPGLSRFRYRLRNNEYGHMVVDHLVRRDHITTSPQER